MTLLELCEGDTSLNCRDTTSLRRLVTPVTWNYTVDNDTTARGEQEQSMRPYSKMHDPGGCTNKVGAIMLSFFLSPQNVKR